MIFSRQHMETAFAYMSVYYNKVLLVNYATNSYKPIKVDDNEWLEVPKTDLFSEWVKGFVYSDKSKLAEDILILADIERMGKQNKPLIFMYKKMVHGKFHNVQLEAYPIGSKLVYVFVRDLDKMEDKENEHAECDKTN